MPLVLGVIPARYASTRFPGKVLAPLAGRTMLEHVWRRASSARRIDRLVVATEDERVVAATERFGGESLLTSPEHASGTDRVAEVVRNFTPRADVVLNVQADEPFVTGTSLDRLIAAFDDASSRPSLATLAEPLEAIDDLFDPNVVKVVARKDGTALYFSRAPIPYHRGAATRLAPDFREVLAARAGGLAGYRRHQGIYAYTREALVALAALPPSPLELDEGLEQLRALEAGHVIRVVDSDFRSLAVDTAADLERAERQWMEVRG
jgi:3-deoxy-manno-octulosonate cytidylyltransferase (CMP-KDO synthetase)